MYGFPYLQGMIGVLGAIGPEGLGITFVARAAFHAVDMIGIAGFGFHVAVTGPGIENIGGLAIGHLALHFHVRMGVVATNKAKPALQGQACYWTPGRLFHQPGAALVAGTGSAMDDKQITALATADPTTHKLLRTLAGTLGFALVYDTQRQLRCQQFRVRALAHPGPREHTQRECHYQA